MTTQFGWAKEAQFAPELASSARARAFVARQLTDHDLAYLVDDIRLVASELVANAAVHAGTPIRLRIEARSSGVKLTVYDERADRPVSQPARRADDNAEGGRGMWVTNACSSDWGTDIGPAGGKSVWALFAVRRKPSWAQE